MTRTHKASPDDYAHASLKASIEVETRRYLWVPEDAIVFVPQVCSHVFGDGRALIEISPIMHRPMFYVVRIDSAWDCDDYGTADGSVSLRDHLDEIYDALEDDFGRSRDEDEENVDLWPAVDIDDGSCWKRRDWPHDRGLALDPHPFVRYRNVLSDVRDSSIVVRRYQPIMARVAIGTLLAMNGGAT